MLTIQMACSMFLLLWMSFMQQEGFYGHAYENLYHGHSHKGLNHGHSHEDLHHGHSHAVNGHTHEHLWHDPGDHHHHHDVHKDFYHSHSHESPQHGQSNYHMQEGTHGHLHSHSPQDHIGGPSQGQAFSDTRGPLPGQRSWTYDVGVTLPIGAVPYFILFLIPVESNFSQHQALHKLLLSFALESLLGDSFLHLILHMLETHSYHGNTAGHPHSHARPTRHGH